MQRCNLFPAVLGLMLLGCVRSHAPIPASVASPQIEAYRALLDSLVPDPRDTILVGESMLVFGPLNGDDPARWRQRFNALPEGLVQELQRLSQSVRPIRDLILPRPTRALSDAELRSSQRRWFAFSPVAFAPNGVDALFYLEYHCGFLCGGGEAIWLTRAPGYRWRVHKMISLWVS